MIEPTPRSQDPVPNTPTRTTQRSDGELRLSLVVRDADLIRELVRQGDDAARLRYAQDALRIGLLALRRARGDVDADQIRNESARLLDALRQQLSMHQQSVQDRIEHKLKEYFDPSSGRFDERVKRLVENGGELEHVMHRLVGAEDSALRKTLDAQLGTDSPLMRALNPSDSEGLLQSLSKRLDEELRQQRDTILREFSLDNREGALARLVRELNEQQGDLVRELDLQEEGSALNKLVTRVERTQRQISEEFSLDREESALARMRRELLALINELRDRNATFQADVMARLAETRGAKEEAKHGTRHGIDFEDAVFQQLQRRCQQSGDVARHTGNAAGLVSRSFKGDAVVELGPETIAPGARIVVEAKQQQNYELAKARDELEAARKNRGAVVGLFVYSQRTAPEGVATFQRIGNDVFIIWDAEDPATDVTLDAGLAVARAIVAGGARDAAQAEVDFDAFERAINEIEKQLKKVEQIQKSANSIQSSTKTILKQARIMGDNIETQVGRLRAQVDGLRQES